MTEVEAKLTILGHHLVTLRSLETTRTECTITSTLDIIEDIMQDLYKEIKALKNRPKFDYRMLETK